MKKYKKLHKSWHEKAFSLTDSSTRRMFYVQGVDDFRMRAVKALEMFSALAVEPPVIYNDKIYVSKDDVAYLIEHLYSDVKDKKPKKSKNNIVNK